MSRFTYPHEAIPADQQFTQHQFASASDLRYIGTHFGLDVYICIKGHETGSIFCVYGNEIHEYYGAITLNLVRTNRNDSTLPAYLVAAYAALMHNPQYIPLVLKDK